MKRRNVKDIFDFSASTGPDNEIAVRFTYGDEQDEVILHLHAGYAPQLIGVLYDALSRIREQAGRWCDESKAATGERK